MKAVILAGGYGTRLSEETISIPKPMVKIGNFPIIWHIMKSYSYYGINDFIICCGYKGYVIKEYFANYFLHMSDVTFELKNNKMNTLLNNSEDWKVTLVDTGEKTMTGGRLKRIKKYLTEDDFCFTYGDGLSNVNIKDLIKFHKEHKKLATITAVRPPGRFGAIKVDSNNLVKKFQEKPDGDNSWINGGFFVLSKKVIDYIDDDHTIWENEPLTNLSNENQLKAFFHNDFWQPMDTLREKINLEKLWASSRSPWKVW